MQKSRNIAIATLLELDGGRTEIRTQGGLAPTPVFKTGAFNRSAILPRLSAMKYNIVFRGGKLKFCKLLSSDDNLHTLTKMQA